MSRIADRDRIVKLLQGSDGQNLGRRDIIDTLNLSDDRYNDVADELCEEDVVAKNRGRTGGLRLVAAARPARPVSKRRSEPDEAPRESELYPPFGRYVRSQAERNDGKSVVLETHQRRIGKWRTPDFVEVRVTPFATVGQWELRIVAYELKRAGAYNAESVLQAAAYSQFAHESWLVVPSGEGDEPWTSRFGPDLVHKAAHFSVGLAIFDEAIPELHKHTHPRPQQAPLVSAQHVWLEDVIGGLGETKVKDEIAQNIESAKRHARS
jgi:hypothetical protein